jgi:hypothetical protein
MSKASRLVVVAIDSVIFYFKLLVLSWPVKGDSYLLVFIFQLWLMM